jgi:hypothetical protein
MKPRFIKPVGERTNFRGLMLASFVIAPDNLYMALMVRSRHPVGNPKRKVWWAQQQVSLSYKTKVYRTSRRKPNFRRLMLASFATLRTMAPEQCWCVIDVGAYSPAAMWNLHTTQPSTLSQLAMRLSISPVCCKQRIKRIKW